MAYGTNTSGNAGQVAIDRFAEMMIALCIITIHHKAEETDFTCLKEFHQLLVCLFRCHIRLLLEFQFD